MATYSSETYLSGAKVRATAESPFYQTFTFKLPAGTAFASADRLNLFKLGADHQILAYKVGTNASIAATTGDSTLTANATNVSGNIADFGGAGATVGAFTSVDYKSADGDAVFLTLGTLGTAVSTGVRSINVSVLVGLVEAAAPVYGAARVEYDSPYTL